MSYESFKQVFAPSSTTIIAQHDNAWKKAKGLIVVDIFLALGLSACIFLLFGNYGDFFARELITKLSLYGVILLFALFVVCGIVTSCYLNKTWCLERELSEGYILSGQYSRNEFYY